MAFGQNTHAASRMTRISGGGNGGDYGGYEDEDEDEGNPLLMIGMTLGFCALLLVGAYFVMGPVLYSYSSDAEPTGHGNLVRSKYNFASIFDMSAAPKSMHGVIESTCGKHSLDEGIDARAIPVGYSLTAYSRALDRVSCILSLPKQHFCSAEGSQYAVDMIIAYDNARGAIAGLNKSVQNLRETVGGSMTLVFSKVEKEINTSVALNMNVDGTGKAVEKTPRKPAASDAILQLHQSPFPAPFDQAVAVHVGALSEEGYISHSQFPDFGLMMPVSISDAMKPQVYSPSCG